MLPTYFKKQGNNILNIYIGYGYINRYNIDFNIK